MARLKVKLTEMKNADVHFISLVKAGANRIPFRVIKSLKESQMSIDLSSARRALKQQKPVPTIVGVVVKSDDAQLPFIAEAVKAAGLVEDKVSKYEDGTVMFAQGELPAEGDGIMVRLSDKLLVVLKNADEQADIMTEASAMSEALQAEGFYHGADVAQKAYAEVVSKAMKSDGSNLKQAGEQFTAYMGALAELVPAKVAELDDGIGGAIQKAEAKKSEDATKAAEEAAKAAAKEKGKVKDKAPEGSAAEEATETPAEEAAEDAAGGGDDNDEDDKGKGKSKGDAKKMDDLLAAVAGLTEAVTAMKAEVTAVKDSQSKLEGQVQEVAAKADKAKEAVDTTVVASAAKGDEPSGRRAAKSDEDPRSGFFDTAFLPKRK